MFIYLILYFFLYLYAFRRFVIFRKNKNLKKKFLHDHSFHTYTYTYMYTYITTYTCTAQYIFIAMVVVRGPKNPTSTKEDSVGQNILKDDDTLFSFSFSLFIAFPFSSEVFNFFISNPSNLTTTTSLRRCPDDDDLNIIFKKQ